MNNTENKENNMRKLDDIRNTAESLMGKIGQLQAALFNNPDKDLEKSLNELNNSFDKIYRNLDDIVTDYKNKNVLPEGG